MPCPWRCGPLTALSPRHLHGLGALALPLQVLQPLLLQPALQGPLLPALALQLLQCGLQGLLLTVQHGPGGTGLSTGHAGTQRPATCSVPTTRPREHSARPVPITTLGQTAAAGTAFRFKGRKDVAGATEVPSRRDKTSRAGRAAGRRVGPAGPHLSWRTSFCTSLRDLSSRSLSALHSQSSALSALTEPRSTASSFCAALAFSCSSLRVRCRSLAMRFSCSTLYANNSTTGKRASKLNRILHQSKASCTNEVTSQRTREGTGCDHFGGQAVSMTRSRRF